MENHALSIGAMKTDCKVLSYPPGVAALRSTMDRALSGPFPAFLANAADACLEGQEGVIRIKSLKIDFAYSGMWDETVLAGVLAARLSEALREALASQASFIRTWPDHVSYMASFVEMLLGLAHEPAWAFPDFDALRLLPPLESALEIVKARPLVLAALANSGQRTGNPFRFIDRLDSGSAARLAAALTGRIKIADLFAFAGQDTNQIQQLAEALTAIHEAEISKRILKLASVSASDFDPDNIMPLLGAAVLTVACERFLAENPPQASADPLDLQTAIARSIANGSVPANLVAFVGTVIGEAKGEALTRSIIAALAGNTGPGMAAKARQTGTQSKGRPKPLILASPFAGFALLLPDSVRLSLHRQIGVAGMRQALLSIPEAGLRERFEKDLLIAALFPDDEDRSEAVFPPVPETGIARLAPESRDLITGKQGAEGWGDFLLASFASRLPGLRASTRGYLLRQFLQVQGHAEISGDVILVTLDGPPLSIILKMAGLSGDQMRMPHLNNRLLVLNIGAPR